LRAMVYEISRTRACVVLVLNASKVCLKLPLHRFIAPG
jgi:hypothetical protein